MPSWLSLLPRSLPLPLLPPSPRRLDSFPYQSTVPGGCGGEALVFSEDGQSINNFAIPGSLLICQQSCSSQFPLVLPRVPARPVSSWEGCLIGGGGTCPCADRGGRGVAPPIAANRALGKRHLEHPGAQAALPLSAPAAVLFAALQVRKRSIRDAGRHGAHPLPLPV